MRDRGPWRQPQRDERLRASEEQFRLTFEAAPIGMALVGLDGAFLQVNPALCALLGFTGDELMELTFQDLTHPDDLDADLELLGSCLSGAIDQYELVKRYLHRAGHEVWVQLDVAVVREPSGSATHFVSQILDITDRRAAAATLAASEARFAALVENGTDLIAITDRLGRLLYASPAYRSVLGMDPDECLGRPLQDHVHPDDRSSVEAAGVDLLRTPGGRATLQFRYGHADGSWRWVEATLTNRLDDPAVRGFVTNTHDITEQVQATERLAHQATHDQLTGLPNRVLLEERLAQARASAIRHDEVLAAVFVDIDRFKDVNDSYGHAAGDLLLAEVARRLRRACRADDTVLRYGGDEFLVVASLASSDAATDLAVRLCESFGEPFELEGLLLSVTSSVGVATARPDQAGDLLAAADAALYEVKGAGRNGWVVRPLGGASSERSAAIPSSPVRSPTSELAVVSERYRAQVASSPRPVVVHTNGMILAASPAAAALVEVGDADDLVGRHILDYISRDSSDIVRERHRAVQAGGWPHAETMRLMTASGRALAVEVDSSPVLWDGALASQVTLRVVTDQWDELVRIGGELTSSLAQAAVITSADLTVAAWNDEAAHVYGWSRDEVLGRNLLGVLPWAGTDAELDVARLALQAHGRWEGRARQRRRDGLVVEVEATTQVLHDRHGAPLGVVSVNIPLGVLNLPSRQDRLAVSELDAAIADRQIEVDYQPIVGLAGEVVKVEALVRWRHPLRGLVPPSDFVPVLEHGGAIAALTAEVLRQACAQAAVWRREGLPQLEVCVNISGRELSDPTLVDRVASALEASGLPADALWLEITETALTHDATQASTGLIQLSTLGVRIALDDFGTGFASLAQLHHCPAHAIKIDRMFVAGLGGEGDDGPGGDEVIVRSIVALGAELGLDVIAEGVETAAQRDALVRIGCHQFQGFLFARPAAIWPTPSWISGGMVVAPR